MLAQCRKVDVDVSTNVPPLTKPARKRGLIERSCSSPKGKAVRLEPTATAAFAQVKNEE